jgi:hypothetical protein
MLLVLPFQDIEKKYPGFIHMKLLQGIKLSFRLQQIVQERILINFFSSSLMPWLNKPEHLSPASNDSIPDIGKKTCLQKLK